MTEKIDILMASYNGEKFIKDQIESIICQVTEYEFRLIISDDNSVDGTVDIIKDFANRYNNVVFLPGPLENLGPKKRFEFLLTQSLSKYIMFSDQDDIWLPNKVDNTLKRMLSVEGRSSYITPILVYSDLSIVDENLRYISKSMRIYKKLRKQSSINSLLIENNVTGCTVMINRALLEHSIPFPEDIYMHDWWMNLIANLYGSTSFIDESLILYRQHASNTFGANIKREDIKSKIKRLIASEDFKKSLAKSILQSVELQKKLAVVPKSKLTQTVDSWIELQQYGRLKKVFYSIVRGYRPGGFWKSFLFLVRL